MCEGSGKASSIGEEKDCPRCNGSGIAPLYMTVDELKKEGETVVSLECETKDCRYKIEKGAMKDVIFQLCMDGGSFSMTDEGVYNSWCPICEKDHLVMSEN